jgi:hypothetical protein
MDQPLNDRPRSVTVDIHIVTDDPATWPPDTNQMIVIAEPLGNGQSGWTGGTARQFRSGAMKSYIMGRHWFIIPDMGGVLV